MSFQRLNKINIFNVLSMCQLLLNPGAEALVVKFTRKLNSWQHGVFSLVKKKVDT